MKPLATHEPRPRTPWTARGITELLAGAALPALFWALWLRSFWTGATTLAMGVVALSWFRAARVPFAARISVVFLLGGTLSAVALLTHRATLP